MHKITREWLNIFLWNLVLGGFVKICRHISFWLKSDNDNRHFTWRPACVSALRSDWMVDSPPGKSLCGESPTIHKALRLDSGEEPRIVTLCARFLTSLLFLLIWVRSWLVIRCNSNKQIAVICLVCHNSYGIICYESISTKYVLHTLNDGGLSSVFLPNPPIYHVTLRNGVHIFYKCVLSFVSFSSLSWMLIYCR
jgi:hypothetical protein